MFEVGEKPVNRDKVTADHGRVGDTVVGPFYPNASTYQVTNGVSYQGLGCGIWPLDDEWIIAYVDSSSHGSTGDVIAVDTDNYGVRTNNKRTIYSGGDVKDGGFIKMDNGRLAAMMSPGLTGDLVFLYSDDNGSTWSTTTLSGPTNTRVYHIFPYPSAAGGADSGGYICYLHGGTKAMI